MAIDKEFVHVISDWVGREIDANGNGAVTKQLVADLATHLSTDGALNAQLIKEDIVNTVREIADILAPDASLEDIDRCIAIALVRIPVGTGVSCYAKYIQKELTIAGYISCVEKG